MSEYRILETNHRLQKWIPQVKTSFGWQGVLKNGGEYISRDLIMRYCRYYSRKSAEKAIKQHRALNSITKENALVKRMHKVR